MKHSITLLALLWAVLLAGSAFSFEPLFDTRIDYAAGNYPHSVSSADLDDDGDNDLAVANSQSDNVSILSNDGDGVGDACDLDEPQRVITLDNVSNLIDDTVMAPGQTYTFTMRITNINTNKDYNPTNGFRIYSPDEAEWFGLSAEWLNGFDAQFVHSFANFFSNDGSGADTVGFAGVAMSVDSGLVDGWDALSWSITIGPTRTLDIGKHICIDSCWFYPSNPWKWADLTQQGDDLPDWSGDTCFIIWAPVHREIELAEVTNSYADTVLGAGQTHSFRLHIRNINSGKNYNPSNGFEVYSPDGATWGSTSAAWLNGLEDNFDHFFSNFFSNDGAIADTVGFAGVALSADGGLIEGWDDIGWEITIGPTSSGDSGKHICIDSCWFYPSNPWKWADLGQHGDDIPSWSGDTCFVIMGCCRGLTGNVDGDPGEIVDIGDLTHLIGYLFIPPNDPPVCMEEGNADGDPGGVVDIGDLTALIQYLFIPPNTPPAECL